tara:strand:+ start:368 stop:496 length:129 start_codon:yes stop_codon:yes gene_type:complete
MQTFGARMHRTEAKFPIQPGVLLSSLFIAMGLVAAWQHVKRR